MKLVDRAILLEHTLILGDLHLGMEESLRKKGTFVPRVQFKKIHQDIERLLKTHTPKKVILNGDIKQDFGSISDQEWREILKIIDLIKKWTELTLIKGNHDTITNIIAKKRNLPVKNHVLIKDTYICHGDKMHENEDINKAQRIIISHVHPAYTLTEGAKQETYKCFLKTTWKKKELWVLPSFTPLVEGSDITREKLFSPFLAKTKKVTVYITQQGETFPFGEVKVI